MSYKDKILIVEDERVIRNFITAVLPAADYSVTQASTGNEALSIISAEEPELVLLDLGLPDIDGLNVLTNIRSWSDVPVIIVSARQYESEKVKALDMGANDYVTKPFGNSELLARIRTAIRQHKKLKNGQPLTDRIFVVNNLCVDYDKRLVKLNNIPVHLTPIEYKIVVLLSKNAGKVLTHDYIINRIWGSFVADSQILRVNMANIRRKIETNPADPKYILTEVGVGYRMIDIISN